MTPLFSSLLFLQRLLPDSFSHPASGAVLEPGCALLFLLPREEVQGSVSDKIDGFSQAMFFEYGAFFVLLQRDFVIYLLLHAVVRDCLSLVALFDS